MTHVLDPVLIDFKSDVGRIENLLTLTKAFRDFGASGPPYAVGEGDAATPISEIWPEAVSFYDASKARRTDLPILAGSMLLYLAGRFEYCIKQIAETIADEVASRTPKYENLPAPIKKALRQKTLEIAQSPKKFGKSETDSDALLEVLVKNLVDPGATTSIKSEIISITEANMRPGVLQDLLKTVGISDFWREIGKQASVKIELEKSNDQDASAAAQAVLNEIMEDRNQIAHPTSSTQFPDADKVLKRAEFLKILAANAVDFGKIYLSSYEA